MDYHEEKAKRITSVRNELSGSDLQRLLPEIWLIEDDDLRKTTARCFQRVCPDYFWERPSSSSGKYHPEDERGEYGNLLHTKRVFMQYRNLASTDLEAGRITEEQYECGKAAALIHDMFKYGWPSDGNEHTTDEHDLIIAAVAEHVCGFPDEVVRLVASHMGAWGAGPEPETVNEWLLHRADKAASPQWTNAGVYEPAEELVETLNVVGYDSDGEKL